MSKLTYLAVFLGGFLALAGPGFAQASDQTVEVDRSEPVAPQGTVDHVVGPAPRPGGGLRVPEGVRMVSPGALLFASFDRDYDGRIGPAEVEAGAAGAFAVADRNRDGSITGFEQSDWAASVGAVGDILSNPMTFDVDLDRSVTRVEFISGLKRLAGQISPNEIAFADLVKPLNQAEEQGEPARGGFGTLTPRARGTLGRPPEGGNPPNAGVGN
jgi:hypothetical protein